MAFPPVVPDATGPLAPRVGPEAWEPASAGPAPRRLPSPWTGIGRNPRTGKEVKIPPGRTIRFKPGKDLQNITQ